MVIVQLIGGLGNQLFQYAVGRHIAFRHQVPLKLDVTTFETYKLHSYSLNHFNIIEDFATPEEVRHFRPRNRVHRMLHKWLPNQHYKQVTEKHFYFDANVLDLSGNVYLEGYWQSERYFTDIEMLLRQELTIKTQPDKQNREIIDMISTHKNAVSIHIRRGDYASNALTLETHGLSPLEYYIAAIQQMIESVSEPHFFVFSDDPAWVRQNLHVEQPMTYVEHNQADRNYEDLRLMSLCQHHIIANSTFSWWGAWLDSNPLKQVIAPKQWFNTPEKDTRDLLPTAWMRL